MNNLYFLISSKHEFFEFKLISNKLNFFNYKFHLLIEDNHRNEGIDLNSLSKSVKVDFLEPINYSKNLFKSFNQKKLLRIKLKKISVNKEDLFIYFHNSSLLFFYLQKFFLKRQIRTLMILSSGFYIREMDSRLNFFETIKINILSYLLTYNFIKLINFRGTIFKNIKSKYLSNFVICLNNEIIPKYYIEKMWDIKSYFPNSKLIKKNNPKYLIILSSYWIDISSEYNETIKDMINKFGKNNLVLKDHPMSNYSNTELSKIYNIDEKVFINKKTSLEEYFVNNFKTIKSVIGPTSAALKYASFMNIPTYCYSNLFMDDDYINYTQKYFERHDIIYFKNKGKIQEKSQSKPQNKTNTINHVFTEILKE